MECNRVHVDRPSSSTSAGQSVAGAGAWTAAALGFLPVVPFIIAIHSAEEVHVRHLGFGLSDHGQRGAVGVDLRLSVLAQNDAWRVILGWRILNGRVFLGRCWLLWEWKGHLRLVYRPPVPSKPSLHLLSNAVGLRCGTSRNLV